MAARRELYRCLVMATLFCLATSCRSHAKVEEPADNLPPAAESIAQADRFYAGREDLNNVRRGVIALGRARLADPASYDAAWRLAKFDGYLATHTDNAAERDKAFREGIEAGKAAVKLQSERPEGHFWLGALYGESAQAGLLQLATVDDIRSEMEAVIRLDEGYQDGSAHMVLVLV